MKTGKTLPALASEVAGLRARAQDYRIAQSALSMNPDDFTLRVDPTTGSNIVIAPNDLMHSQLAEKLGVPGRYYNRMMAEAPELLARNVNTWLHKSPEKRFVRTLDNANNCTGVNAAKLNALTGRAFLGNGYKPLDNYDMMEALLPPLSHAGLSVASAEVTDQRLYLQLVTEKIQSTVQMLAPGTHNRINDVLQLGLVVSNSEVGCGALSIQVLVYRLVCTNGLIVSEDMPGFRKIHVGRELDRADNVVFKDETKRLTDAAIWAQARDAITAAVNQTTLDKITDRLNGVAQVRLQDPAKAVELVTKRFDISQDEGKGVMANLISGGDVSQWGLVNAVTALANTAASYDRAIELETIGGKVAMLTPGAFGNN